MTFRACIGWATVSGRRSEACNNRLTADEREESLFQVLRRNLQLLAYVKSTDASVVEQMVPVQYRRSRLDDMSWTTVG